jgi:4-hydroxymandelate synthase
MEITGIDHVEFYVADALQHAAHFRTGFEFRVGGQGAPETGLVDQRSVLLSQGAVQLVLTSGVTSDHPAAEYVERHGDGVAVIALSTDDAEHAFAEAVRRGAIALEPPREHVGAEETVVTAAVSAFGDVAHRFVSRHGVGGQFLPGAIEMVPGTPDGGLLRSLDHVAVCLPAGALASTVDRYRQVFGFAEIFHEHIEVGDQAMDSKVVQSSSGGVTLTLIEPDSSRQLGQIDDFLVAHGGAGVQHLAFLTDDITAAVRRCERRGVTFLRTPGSYYDHLAERLGEIDLPVDVLRETNVLVDRDHAGQLFQIFTRSTHPRRTFFLELIDRHGARTFGSGNIKALYEAVERERVGTR